MTEVKLTRGAKIRAVRAIESVHTTYDEKDGLRELIAKAETKQVVISTHVHGLAVFAVRQEKDVERGTALFLAMCTYAEEAYKTKHEVTDLEKAIPVWKVYKSNILAAMRLGLNPAEFEGEYALRKAKDERIRKTVVDVGEPVRAGAMATVTSINKPRAGPAKPQTQEQITEMLTDTTI